MNVAAIRWLRLLAKVGMVLAALGWLVQSFGMYDLWAQLMAVPPGTPGQRRILFQVVVQPVMTALTPLAASGLLFVACEIALHLNRPARLESEK